jgi:uncharacterized membrane protein YjfL (UPF0719 family)
MPRFLSWLFCAALPLAVSAAGADETGVALDWHATSLGQAIGYMVLFAAIGVVLAILAYKLFDKCTPGDLHREIIDNRNVAAAILGGAVILGVCLIIAAAMLG